MTAEAIEARYPGLIEALARHPGIGALLVRSAAGHVLVRGADGRLDLTDGRPTARTPSPTMVHWRQMTCGTSSASRMLVT